MRMQMAYEAAAAALLGWGLTGLVLRAVRRMQVLAPPTDRGLHKVPTPVGGGLGLIGGALIVFLLIHPPAPPLGVPLLAALGVLALVSWVDDRRPRPPLVRFSAQALAVGLLLWHLPLDLRLVPAVPLETERFALAIAWMWVINLTNFMDGIDGLAGMEAVTVGTGYALVASLIASFIGSSPPLMTHLPELAIALAAAAIGYLIWNWAPARIFMGDVGSIPLGLLFGLLMLDLALRGQWPAALILPMYFLVDATLTLFERLGRGSKPWQAHREHAYQRAVLAGMTHSTVTLHIAALNVALVALAVASIRFPLPAFAAAGLLTYALRQWLLDRKPPAP